MDETLVRQHDIFAAMRKSHSVDCPVRFHSITHTLVRYSQKAPRIKGIVPGEKSVRDFGGILSHFAVRQTFALPVHFDVHRQHGVVVAGEGALPVILLGLDAGHLVHFTRWIAAVVRHQIRHASALLVGHLTSALGHAVDEGVLLERGQSNVCG